MEHGLKHITFYVQKHIAALGRCYNPELVRDKPLGVPASVKLVYEKYSSLGSDNGMALERRQAIVWNNDGLVYQRIYASLGLNELTHWGRNKMAAFCKYVLMLEIFVFDSHFTILLEIVPKDPISSKPALAQIMILWWLGDKTFSAPMMA